MPIIRGTRRVPKAREELGAEFRSTLRILTRGIRTRATTLKGWKFALERTGVNPDECGDIGHLQTERFDFGAPWAFEPFVSPRRCLESERESPQTD